MLVWKLLCRKVCPNLKFMPTWLINKTDCLLNWFLEQLRKVVTRYKKTSDNMDMLQHTACTVDNFASLFNYRWWVDPQIKWRLPPHSGLDDWCQIIILCGRALCVHVCFVCVFWLQIVIGLFALFHHNDFYFLCCIMMFHRCGRIPLCRSNIHTYNSFTATGEIIGFCKQHRSSWDGSLSRFIWIYAVWHSVFQFYI